MFASQKAMRLLVLGAIVAAPFTARVVEGNEGRSSLLLDAPLLAGCEYTCRECSRGHDIVQSVSNNADSSHLETCNPDSCSKHACDGDWLVDARAAEVWEKIRYADASELQMVLTRYADVASFNETRKAVQIHCSRGSVIANLPLPNDVALALAEDD